MDYRHSLKKMLEKRTLIGKRKTIVQKKTVTYQIREFTNQCLTSIFIVIAAIELHHQLTFTLTHLATYHSS